MRTALLLNTGVASDLTVAWPFSKTQVKIVVENSRWIWLMLPDTLLGCFWIETWSGKDPLSGPVMGVLEAVFRG